MVSAGAYFRVSAAFSSSDAAAGKVQVSRAWLTPALSVSAANLIRRSPSPPACSGGSKATSNGPFHAGLVIWIVLTTPNSAGFAGKFVVCWEPSTFVSRALAWPPGGTPKEATIMRMGTSCWAFRA